MRKGNAWKESGYFFNQIDGEEEDILGWAVKKHLEMYEGFGKMISEGFNIDYEPNKGKLMAVSAEALDKFWRIIMEHREDPLFKKYDDEQTVEILYISVNERLLSKGIIPKFKKEKIIKAMNKYQDAFEEELKNYSKPE